MEFSELLLNFLWPRMTHAFCQHSSVCEAPLPMYAGSAKLAMSAPFPLLLPLPPRGPQNPLRNCIQNHRTVPASAPAHCQKIELPKAGCSSYNSPAQKPPLPLSTALLFLSQFLFPTLMESLLQSKLDAVFLECLILSCLATCSFQG